MVYIELIRRFLFETKDIPLWKSALFWFVATGILGAVGVFIIFDRGFSFLGYIFVTWILSIIALTWIHTNPVFTAFLPLFKNKHFQYGLVTFLLLKALVHYVLFSLGFVFFLTGFSIEPFLEHSDIFSRIFFVLFALLQVFLVPEYSAFAGFLLFVLIFGDPMTPAEIVFLGLPMTLLSVFCSTLFLSWGFGLPFFRNEKSS